MKIDLDELHVLYEHALSVKDMKPQQSEEYHLFSIEDGSRPAKVFSPKSHLDYLPLCPELYEYFKRCKAIWMIPVELPSDRVVGYVMRDFHSSIYRTIGPEYGFPLIYNLQCLKYYDNKSPVILTEGVKDCKALRLAYPYVLAALSNGLPVNAINVLSRITNHVVLAFDNDSGGRRLLTTMREKFMERGCFTSELLPPVNGMDWASSVFTPEVFERLKMMVPSIRN